MPSAPGIELTTATTVTLLHAGQGFAGTVLHAVFEETTQSFVGADGRLLPTPTEFWQPLQEWGGFVVRALHPSTDYRFKTKVQITPGSQTEFGPPVAVSTSVQGDVDGDGAITQTDVAIVQTALQTQFGQPGFDARADLDGDDNVTFADLGIVQLALVHKGDYNGNGVVDLEDFSVFSTCVAGPGAVLPFDDCPALSDFDLDGDVDLHDVALFMRVFVGS